MYVLRRPAPQLREFIEHYWFVLDEGLGADLEVQVFADVRADLIFNFGVPYRRSVIGGDTVEIAHSNFDAQRLVPIRIQQRGAVRVEGVRFQLGGVAPFTATRLADWSGSTPEPQVVFGDPVVDIETALRSEPDPDAAAYLLDRFFLQQLEQHGPHPGFVQALALLQADETRAPVELAREVGVSIRHLERLFARELGYPPKVVARVLRFQRTLRQLMDDRHIALGDLAETAGYFDQAHFIRDFRRFSGGVPRGYRGYYPPDGPSDFAPNVVVFVQDDEPDATS